MKYPEFQEKDVKKVTKLAPKEGKDVKMYNPDTSKMSTRPTPSEEKAWVNGLRDLLSGSKDKTISGLTDKEEQQRKEQHQKTREKFKDKPFPGEDHRFKILTTSGNYQVDDASAKSIIRHNNKKAIKEAIEEVQEILDKLNESTEDIVDKLRDDASKAPFNIYANNNPYIEKSKHAWKIRDAVIRAHQADNANLDTPLKYRKHYENRETKNEKGDLKTRYRRVSNKQIKKSIARHNAKVNGESTKKPLDKFDFTKIPLKDFTGHGKYKSAQDRINNSIARHNKKAANESFLSQVLSLKEEFSSIFEGSQKEVNKIKKVKTHTDPNEPTEVVSVADELFPREGNAKQQYNQKVLDIINGMIEGSNTLEDLIQFVRKQKVNGVKEDK